MLGKTHVAAGCLLTAALAPPINNALGLGLSPEELAIGVVIGGIAGELPDIDHPNSFITHGVIPGEKFFGPLGKALGYFASIPPRIIGVGARATMNHRGGTHSALFMVGWAALAAPLYIAVFSVALILASIIWTPVAAMFSIGQGFQAKPVIEWMVHSIPSITPLVALCVFLGYLAHLLTDSMTKVPVPWPWPFSKKRFFILPKPMRLTTGSDIEVYLVRPLIIVLFAAAFTWNIGIPLFSSVTNEVKEVITKEKSSPDGENINKKYGGWNEYDNIPEIKKRKEKRQKVRDKETRVKKKRKIKRKAKRKKEAKLKKQKQQKGKTRKRKDNGKLGLGGTSLPSITDVR